MQNDLSLIQSTQGRDCISKGTTVTLSNQPTFYMQLFVNTEAGPKEITSYLPTMLQSLQKKVSKQTKPTNTHKNSTKQNQP